MNYAVRGAEDGSGVPKFLTMGHDFTTQYLPSLLRELQEELSRAPTQVGIAGLERVIVSEGLLKQVRSEIGPVTNRGLKLVSFPIPDAISKLREGYAQRVKNEVPPDYVPQALTAIDECLPRFAATVQEAARALGLQPK